MKDKAYDLTAAGMRSLTVDMYKDFFAALDERLIWKALLIPVAWVVAVLFFSQWILLATAWRMTAGVFFAPPPRTSHRIARPPGSWLLAIAAFLYPKKTYKLTFEPVVADMREEYFAALYEGRIWKARWMHGLYVWKFFCAMGLNCGFSFIEKVLKTWRVNG